MGNNTTMDKMKENKCTYPLIRWDVQFLCCGPHPGCCPAFNLTWNVWWCIRG